MKTSLKLAAAALALGFTSVPVLAAGAFADTAVQDAAASDHDGERSHRWGHRGHRGNPDMFAERMARIDTNSDGVITRAEFQAHHSAMFDRMDANNDGVVNAADRELVRSLWAEFAAERGVEVGSEHGRWGQRSGEQEISRADFEARGTAMFDRMAGEGNDSVAIADLEERMSQMRSRGGERRSFRRRD